MSSEGWVNCSCPIAEYTHLSGKDYHPSFGATIREDGPSYYKCWTCCEDPKPLQHLIHQIWVNTGKYPWGLAEIYNELEIWKTEKLLPEYDDKWIIEAHSDVLDFIPQPVVDIFPNVTSKRFPELHQYLLNRGISEKTYTRFDVRATPRRDLVFIFTNILGNAKAIVYRSMINKRISILKAEHLQLTGIQFPKKGESGAWFGIHLIEIGKPLLIVESEIDQMRSYELGFHNVIASGGTGVTKQQVKSLQNQVIYIGFDSDSPGKKGARRLAKMIGDSASVWFVDWSYAKAKDAGDIRKKDDFDYCISNLKAVVI